MRNFLQSNFTYIIISFVLVLIFFGCKKKFKTKHNSAYSRNKKIINSGVKSTDKPDNISNKHDFSDKKNNEKPRKDVIKNTLSPKPSKIIEQNNTHEALVNKTKPINKVLFKKNNYDKTVNNQKNIIDKSLETEITKSNKAAQKQIINTKEQKPKNDINKTQFIALKSQSNANNDTNVLSTKNKQLINRLLLMAEFLKGDWREEDTEKLILCFNKYFKKALFDINRLFNIKNIDKNNSNKNQNITNKESFRIKIKENKKELSNNVQILKSVTKNLKLDFENKIIYSKSVIMLNNILDGVKSIAAAINCANVHNWHLELMDATFNFVASSSSAIKKVKMLEREIKKLKNKTFITKLNNNDNEKQGTICFAECMESAKIRQNQLYTVSENIALHMNKIKSTGKNDLQNEIKNDNKLLKFKNSIMLISNMSTIEFIVAKYIASGAIRVDNLEQKIKKRILIAFSKVKERYDKIQQLAVDINKIYEIKSNKRQSKIKKILRKSLFSINLKK